MINQDVDQFEWARPGMDVVILTSRRITNTKVTKVSKTRVTTQAGDVFYVPKWSPEPVLRKVGEGDWEFVRLYAPDHPVVTATRERFAREGINRDARAAAEKFCRRVNGTKSANIDAARETIAALEAYIAMQESE